MNHECAITDLGGCCAVCAEIARKEHRAARAIEGPVHIYRVLVDTKYGLVSQPFVYCQEHCPVHSAKVRVA